jgi:hypothetical protein
MARASRYQNRCQSDQTVLKDAHITFPREEKFNLPLDRVRIHQQRDEGAHGKGIEKQTVKPIFVPQSALKKIRDRDGYQGAMNDAVGNP